MAVSTLSTDGVPLFWEAFAGVSPGAQNPRLQRSIIPVSIHCQMHTRHLPNTSRGLKQDSQDTHVNAGHSSGVTKPDKRGPGSEASSHKDHWLC